MSLPEEDQKKIVEMKNRVEELEGKVLQNRAKIGEIIEKAIPEGEEIDEGTQVLLGEAAPLLKENIAGAKEADDLKEEIARIQNAVRCPSCGTAVDDDALFCPMCGTPIVRNKDAAPGTCPHCGNAVKDSDLFCPHCGYSLKMIPQNRIPEPEPEQEPEPAPGPETEEPVEMLFCPNCGTRIRADVERCPECGCLIADFF